MDMNTQDGRFRFSVPLDLIKSDDQGWQIQGLASTEDKDLQGEIVKQEGLDLTALKQGLGLFNYEHRNNPEDIVGAIEDANISKDGLMVKGYLFRNHKRAQAIAEIMQSLKKTHAKRVKLSIEGVVKERAGHNDKIIKQAMVDRVAVTFGPVNQHTYMQFAKSLTGLETETETKMETLAKADPKDILTDQALEEEIQKTLTAGGGGVNVPPATMTGGSALSPESLIGDKHEPEKLIETPKPKKKKYKPEVAKAIILSVMRFIKSKYPEISKEDLSELVETEVLERLEEDPNA